MELDLLYEIDVAAAVGRQAAPVGQREREQRAYGEMIEQVKLADRMGFNIAWFVEHHFRQGRSHCPAPEVVIGALTQATKNLRLGFGVTLLPYGFTHPARVAEKVATADILSGGRVEWGTGRSTPMEQASFHVDRNKSRGEWEEASVSSRRCGARSTSSGTAPPSSSRGAWSRPSPCSTRIRRAGWRPPPKDRPRSRA